MSDSLTEWLRVDKAVRKLHEQVKRHGGDDDKAADRSKAIMLRALLLGDLVAFFRAEGRLLEVPAWAWADREYQDSAWWGGGLLLCPTLPPEWREWSGAETSLCKDAFNAWLASNGADSPALGSADQLGVQPEPHDSKKRPAPELRLPSDQPFIPFTEAISWIAFGTAFNAPDLRLYCGDDPARLQELSGGVRSFVAWAQGGDVEVRGKFLATSRHGAAPVDTATIPPVRFADFGRYDLISDRLGRCGRGGLSLAPRDVIEEPGDEYAELLVSRGTLLARWPAEGSTSEKRTRSAGAISAPDRRPVSARDLQVWFAGYCDSHDIASENVDLVILPAAKLHFRDKLVSRDAVRDLVRAIEPARKRGPKALRGNRPA